MWLLTADVAVDWAFISQKIIKENLRNWLVLIHLFMPLSSKPKSALNSKIKIAAHLEQFPLTTSYLSRVDESRCKWRQISKKHGSSPDGGGLNGGK
ncbi:hypothetical protein ES332_D01G245400v1 [Gossypium tomentosum]|uniref:Uncharacterized protein n=1 Tax=Gossypium tomentosum TaxID=34277 RepID=A0A5D2MCQ5_GOSTO|nr:hypothetical protein ES332_D01G245400v1 [Gossypium tomentosum]